MALLDATMTYYPYVFHPITVLGVGILLLVHHEWTLQGGNRTSLKRRVAGFLGPGVLGLVPTVAYFVVTGANPVEATVGNTWMMDALVAGGIFIACAATWYVWRRFEWGALVPGGMVAIVAATVPYIALSYFWNVSGHVIISLVPALYLTLVDRKFWPGLAVPAVMIPNRIYLDAHTWPQTIGGFVIGASVTLAVYWWQNDGSFGPRPRSTSLVD